MRPYSRFLLIAALGACQPPTDASQPVDVRLLSNILWGTQREVTVRSAAFGPDRSGSYDSVRFRLDERAAPLGVRRLDDSTFAVVLPAALSGAHALSVSVGGLTYPLGKVTIYGFVAAFSLPVPLSEDLLLWPRTGDASVIASDPQLGVVIASASQRTVQVIPQAKNILRGPGVTPREGEFLLLPPLGDSVEGWSVYPTAAPIVTHQMRLSGGRQVMQLSDHGWLVTLHHSLTLLRRADSASPWESEGIGGVEESEGVHMSPRRDRATIRVDAAEGGAPIFDTRTATVAYRSPMRSSQGVDFSPDGSRLLLAGGHGSSTGPYGVVLLDAESGAEIASHPLDREPFGATIDRLSDYAFVGVVEEDRPVVLVYDAETLAPVTELRVPASVPMCYCYKGVIATSNEPAVYVITLGSPVQVYRFGMPPAD